MGGLDNQYVKDWDLFLRRKEEKFTREFYKALQQQVKQFSISGDPNKISSAPIISVLESLYKEVGPQWAHKSVLHIRAQQTKARMPMGFNERIVQLMRLYFGIDLYNYSELMTQTSREVIVTVLSEAAQAGWSFDEIVRKLTAHPDFSAMRARRIARTETITAANGAAIINAKESGLSLNKKWLSVNDKRTRPDHRLVNGQEVPIDQEFNVNGIGMQQPGVRKQDNGQDVPPKEFVNCRCVVGFIPLRDSAGRLI